MLIFLFFFTGDRQWELRRCLPGQALRDWRNGGHQESVAGQAFQEPRTADNETLGALQHCQGQSILSFFTQKVGLMKAVAVVFCIARQSLSGGTKPIFTSRATVWSRNG